MNQPRERRRHDYGICKGNCPKLPKGVRPGVDLGYDGIKKDFPELNALIPFKRRGGRGRKGRDLTSSQNCFNKQLAKATLPVWGKVEENYSRCSG